MTLTAERAGVAVMLVYGIEIPVARDGLPGFRLTVQLDGAVWVQPVGFLSREEADRAQLWCHQECVAAGLFVERLPVPAQPPGFVVRRRRPTDPQPSRRYY